MRELRDLNRHRVALIGERNRVSNRVQKVLEDANIKLAAVARDPLGSSGRDLLEAIVRGEEDADQRSIAAINAGGCSENTCGLARSLTGAVLVNVGTEPSASASGQAYGMFIIGGARERW